jgi:hypothetical protein
MNHYDAHGLHYRCRVDISTLKYKDGEITSNRFYNRKYMITPHFISSLVSYAYVRRNFQDNICLIEISLSALHIINISLPMATQRLVQRNYSTQSRILTTCPGMSEWKILARHDDGKRKMCAEVLIFLA